MLGKPLERDLWPNVGIIRDVINMDSEEILLKVNRTHTPVYVCVYIYIYIYIYNLTNVPGSLYKC